PQCGAIGFLIAVKQRVVVKRNRRRLFSDDALMARMLVEALFRRFGIDSRRHAAALRAVKALVTTQETISSNVSVEISRRAASVCMILKTSSVSGTIRCTVLDFWGDGSSTWIGRFNGTLAASCAVRTIFGRAMGH